MPRPLPRFPRPYRAVLLSPQRRGYLSGFANRSYAYNPSAAPWLWQAYDTGTKSPFGRLARLCRWCKGLGPRFKERSAPTSRKAREPGAPGEPQLSWKGNCKRFAGKRGRHARCLILQAQEKQGQSDGGVVYGDGKSATPHFHTEPGPRGRGALAS